MVIPESSKLQFLPWRHKTHGKTHGKTRPIAMQQIFSTAIKTVQLMRKTPAVSGKLKQYGWLVNMMGNLWIIYG